MIAPRMHRILQILLLCAVSLPGAGTLRADGRQLPPEGDAPRDFALPPAERFTLPNGLQVTLAPFGSVPKALITVAVRAGNLNEAADEIWLADLTGALMKEGTTTRSAAQVAREAAGMGGEIAVETGPDMTGIGADVLSEFAPDMVGLLADVVRRPLLPASEVPRLKQDLLRQLSVARTQPGVLAQQRFYGILYPDHPYGRVLPDEATIDAFTPAQARAFHQHNFGAARTHVYVAGQFDPGAVRRAIVAAFADWERGAEPLVMIPAAKPAPGLATVDRPGAPQSTIYIGLPAVDPSHPDFIALQVMNTLLGGSFSSRMTQNLREDKGYTYSPYSYIDVRYRNAVWLQVADVTTAVTGASIKEVLFEIDRLRNAPPDAQELKGFQNYIAGVFVLQNSSRAGVVSRLQYTDLHGLGADYLQTFVGKVHAVTPEQVRQMAERYVRPADLTMVVVGDEQAIADQLAPFTGDETDATEE